MTRIRFRCDAALESIADISDSADRESYIARHELVDLIIEAQHSDAWKAFNKLPITVLPRLPHAYRWVRVEDKYTIIRDKTAASQELALILYGPNSENRINYLFQVDGRTTFGFAHTRTTQEPKRDYPMNPAAKYRVGGFDYSDHRYGQHVRGHIIDHKDTIQENSTRSLWSTYDARNYIPEPPDYDWGLGIRKAKVAEIRGDKGAYSQFMEYGDDPDFTADGTAVPSKIYFVAYSYHQNQYIMDGEPFHIDFTEDLSRPKASIRYLDYASKELTIAQEATPGVVPYSPKFTDRALRLDRRNASKRATSIVDGSIKSRFPDRDAEYAYCDSADIEFEGVSQRLHTGGFANSHDNPILGLEYVRRAMLFGDAQLSLEGVKPIITQAAEDAGYSFFGDYQGSEDTDSLLDHFEKLLKDQQKARK